MDSLSPFFLHGSPRGRWPSIIFLGSGRILAGSEALFFDLLDSENYRQPQTSMDRSAILRMARDQEKYFMMRGLGVHDNKQCKFL